MTGKNKHYCSVPQCSNYRSNNVTIHMFPSNKILREKWRVALRIGKKITNGMMVCSEHFLKEDFFPATEYTKKIFLKKNVIPSQKIPKRPFDKPQPSTSSGRSCAKARHKSKIYSEENPERYDEIMNMDITVATVEDISEEKFKEIGVQVNTILELKSKHDFLSYLLESTGKLGVVCGVNKVVFNTILIVVTNTLKLFKDITSVNLRTKICVVLIKLKLNISFQAISTLFDISSTSTQMYFKEFIQIMYYALKTAIYFPTKEDNMKNLPKCFKNYSNVRIVIDATEIPIQETKCLGCRMRTYSQCKKSHTAKFLICMSPAGLIAYVSSAYGGHVSDKAIFNNEKIIDLLDSYHDAIMVHKGILIEKECSEYGTKLIRPPFVRKNNQISSKEFEETALIARARVHVKHIMQRIKNFQIFNNKLEWSLVPYLDEMMVIVCSLVNLSRPILGDDKF